MPRSSRHKSHKQIKKEAKEYSESEEDVKMKERNNSKEDGAVRVSRDSVHSASGEKRKLGREGKDLSGHGNGNGDVSEEYVSSKRRKEKAADGSRGGGSGRWNGGGDEKGDGGTKEKELKGESSRIDSEKGLKVGESKVSDDSKSKSTRRHESGGEKKDQNLGCTMGKEESKCGTRTDSKRKSEKDSGRKELHQYKDSKEPKEKEPKERGSDKERKGQDSKGDAKGHTGNGEVVRKQGSPLADLTEERQSRQGRENSGWPMQDELQNPELEKELEKRIQRRRDGSIDKDKNQDKVRGSDDKRLSSRADHTKDGRYKDERHKDGSYGDKYREDGDIDNRQRDDKYQDDGERDSRRSNVKYRKDSEKDSRHRDGKYQEDGDRDSRRRDDKYREGGERDNRHRDDKYREDSDREDRRPDDKYRADGDRDNRQRDNKYHDDGEKDNRRSDNRYREDGEKDDRRRDDKYREDGNRENRYKKEKHREDDDRDSRHRDGKEGDDIDREKRPRDVKFRDDLGSRDHTSHKSDVKRSRDESNITDVYHRRSSTRDGSPSYKDRVTRRKDDQGRRRANDKEDHDDMRSTKEQRSDAEKRSLSTAKVDLVSDRGRSSSRNGDVEITLNYSRRRSSPSSSSQAARDNYRLSKQEESKYRDYAYEERVRHGPMSGREYANAAGGTDKISSMWSVDKPIQKDDSHFGELSAERHLKSDARASPLWMVDKSPSSTNADRRHLNRSNVRRSLDVEELGQRSGGSKDAKDYSGKEGRGSRELPMETLPGDEDGDNLSVSSSFTRSGQFYGNSKSLLPPPPPPHSYRTGVDSPLVFGSSEDGNRGKSINRHRRIGDPNLGRVHGSAWKCVPNWPSPVANGFMPFQHGPPPVSFHPVMQQFPVPPMFGVRPPMELNHTGVPYHIPDSGRFSGPGRPLGWRNPVDSSFPPPLHGWDANNALFGDESHIYGGPDWDHNRTQISSREWEASGDMWKGQNTGASMELPSSYQKKDHSALGPVDDVWDIQSGQQAQNEQNQLDLQAESIDISQSSDALGRITPEAPKTISEESLGISKMLIKDDTPLWHVYLSKLDISTDLTQPELYNQCANLMDKDQNTISDENDSKILYVQKVAEAKVRASTKSSSASLFAAINSSVFQKAMSLYKRQLEETEVRNGEKISFANVEDLKRSPTSDQEGLVVACDWQEASKEKAEMPICFQTLEEVPATVYSKLDEPVVTDTLEKSEEPLSNLNKVKMEVDPSSDQKSLEFMDEKNSVSLKDVEGSDAQSPGRIEDVNKSINSGGNHSALNYKEQNLFDTKCDPLVFSDVSSDVCGAVMPESIESGLVNLSRIHHCPESTH
ncbi:unnamed protein product [Ilex paraguariensis]|uniref:Uncharacterized protein n=1 Tax=Ilex paraguariensis TaxID=185542 RepID=A0ABC8T1H0_9AQUA